MDLKIVIYRLDNAVFCRIFGKLGKVTGGEEACLRAGVTM